MENKVTLTAHRGWRAKYPENTMLGFREALKLDIDGIEMDAHMTADYRIVVCHDGRLDRTQRAGSVHRFRCGVCNDPPRLRIQGQR